MVTQNIDNLHVEAQELSKKNNKNFKNYPIYEIHGNILKIRCDKCTEKDQKLCFQPY
jgi:NAD-dependent SIR2 family protein deacetylase